MNKKRYLTIIEGSEETNFSAIAPDVPGCVATGPTREQCKREMGKALAFHFEGLRRAGEEIPEPATYGDYVTVEG